MFVPERPDTPDMPTPKKPGGNMSWFDYFFGAASKKATSTWSEMVAEYKAGREGRPSPQAPKRPPSPAAPRATGPAWWEVLHVPRGASLRDAAAAYRELIQKNHPDKVAHLSERIRRVADEETRRINAAYAEARRMLGSGKTPR
jgi:DnaJ-class molecular chaperone